MDYQQCFNDFVTKTKELGYQEKEGSAITKAVAEKEYIKARINLVLRLNKFLNTQLK